ncbi:hypothetical protein HHK36_014848 [Tetracentron sinense]|uniref:RanBP2-type domain-containing protein n=1 Tax=Tetracentron sinense TaxID=13715 RepID=A0A835DD33_TETSI|nr:hypothetical protein HHK36_014848 [Tetracentron sinense]
MRREPWLPLELPPLPPPDQDIQIWRKGRKTHKIWFSYPTYLESSGPPTNSGWGNEFNDEQAPVEILVPTPAQAEKLVPTPAPTIGMMAATHSAESSRKSSSQQNSRRNKSRRHKEEKIDESTLVSMEVVNQISKLSTTSPSQPSVQEFHKELRELKDHVKTLDRRISKIELQKDPVSSFQCTDEVKDLLEKENEKEGGLFVGAMTHQAQKWITQLTIKVRGTTHKDVLANFDSGSDFNCIQSSLVPARYWKKCAEKARAVDGSQLETRCMVRDIHVCKGGECVKMDFIVMKDLVIQDLEEGEFNPRSTSKAADSLFEYGEFGGEFSTKSWKDAIKVLQETNSCTFKHEREGCCIIRTEVVIKEVTLLYINEMPLKEKAFDLGVLESLEFKCVDIGVMKYFLSMMYECLSGYEFISYRCNFMNFSRNTRCLQCQEDGPKRVSVEDVEMKKGDWNCLQCRFMNFARNTKCLRCQESRPKRQLNPGEWECPSCDFLNYRRNMLCLKCNCERPKDEVLQYEDQIWRKPR